MNSPGKISLVCLALCLAVVEIESRQLLMIHEIFRHGARYPIYNSTKDYSGFAKDQREAGELTLQGKHMQYILGKSMYDKYWEDLFADTPYIQKYHPSQFYVKSTNVNRTIESAESQLLGLLEDLPPSTLPIDQLENSFPPFLGAEAYEDHPLNESDFSVFGGKHTDFHAIPIHTVKPSKVPESASYQYSSNPYDEGDFLAKYEDENCPNQAFWSK